MEKFKIIFYCPRESSKEILTTLAGFGFGKVGNYDSWSVVSEVIESFRPLEGSHPSQGMIGKITEAPSHKIELHCFQSELDSLLGKIRETHPYEEPAIEVIPLYSAN